MKRIAWIFAATILAFVTLVALFVALLPRDALKTRVGEQIAAWTGRDVSLSGEPEIGFFPALTVTLRDVRVSGPPDMADSEILSIERLRGTIRLLPLIIGRVEISSFAMQRPVVRLVRDRSGERNWAFDSGAAALQLAFAGDVPLGEFVLEDGMVVYDDRQAGTSRRLDQVNLEISWPSVRRPLSLSGSAVWRGEAVTFAGNAEAPFGFLNGDVTPVDARFESAPLSIAFAGEASDIDLIRLAGDLSMATPSFTAFAAWFGSPLAAATSLGAASLSGKALFHQAALSVEDAEIVVDGNRGAGAIEVRSRQPMSVTGTLAFAELDLSRYFAGLGEALSGDRNWRDVGLDTDWFGELAADVRLSAGSVALGGLSFGETAASVTLRDGRLEIGVAEAAVGGGALAGDLAIVDGEPSDAFAASAQLRATRVDLAEAAAGWDAEISGTADVRVDLSGKGIDLGSLATSLTGTASLAIVDGALPLAGLPALAGEAADDAATAIDSFDAALAISDGTAVLERGVVVTPQFSAEARGTIGLDAFRLDLEGDLRRAGEAAQTVFFSVDGTLAEPVVRALPAAE